MTIAASGIDASANPWLPLCSIRLSAINDPSIPSTEMKKKYIQELRWMEEARSAIRYRLNMLSLIARLTPELLAHVFRHLADTDVPYAIKGRDGDKGYSGWMKVTHVCRSWRTVALDYPDLWGRGDICSPRSWMEERLRRSKDAPFDVIFGYSSPLETRIPSSVLLNANRIRCATLRTHLPWDATDGSWHDLLSSSAASLASFSYSNLGLVVGAVSHDTLPVNVFDCKAPRLKSLRLQGTLLPFESPIYENLAHLRLGRLCRRDPHYRGPPPFIREQLLALLHRMPKLESLIVENGAIPGKSPNVENFEHGAQAPLPTPGPVALSSLQTLELYEIQSTCVWMATQLAVPAAASIKIMPAPPYEEYEAAGRAWLPLLMRHLGARDCVRPTQTMSFKLARCSWRFICWEELVYSDIDARKTYKFDRTEGTSWVEDGSKPPCCNISSNSGSLNVTIDVLETIVRPILSEAATCNIRILDICGAESQIGYNDWLELFASFTALESLTLGDTVIAFNFVQVFGLDLALNLDTFTTAGDTPHTLFPSLRVLMFREVDFKHFVDTADARLSELMTESLIERVMINTKLEEIRLIQCEWNQQWIDTMRRIGPKVHCEAPMPWESPRRLIGFH